MGKGCTHCSVIHGRGRMTIDSEGVLSFLPPDHTERGRAGGEVKTS